VEYVVRELRSSKLDFKSPAVQTTARCPKRPRQTQQSRAMPGSRKGCPFHLDVSYSLSLLSASFSKRLLAAGTRYSDDDNITGFSERVEVAPSANIIREREQESKCC